MSDREHLRPEEARAARLVRALETPEPSLVFRSRLRESFVSGKIADEAARSPLPPDARAPWRRLTVLRWAGAAASGVLVVFAVVSLNRAPAWRLIETEGLGVVTVDGRPVALNHAGELEAMLQPGSRVRVPEGATISIVSEGQMALDLTSGSDIVIPRPPGRWFGRAAYAEVNAGVLRIATGNGFRGARMRVATPAADVEVTGTTLAVICEPVGTCVCVLDGRVDVGPKGGEMAVVEPGRRRFVFLDGTDEQDVMRDAEVSKLTALRDARRAELER